VKLASPGAREHGSDPVADLLRADLDRQVAVVAHGLGDHGAVRVPIDPRTAGDLDRRGGVRGEIEHEVVTENQRPADRNGAVAQSAAGAGERANDVVRRRRLLGVAFMVASVVVAREAEAVAGSWRGVRRQGVAAGIAYPHVHLLGEKMQGDRLRGRRGRSDGHDRRAHGNRRGRTFDPTHGPAPPYGWSVPGPAPPGLQGVRITPQIKNRQKSLGLDWIVPALAEADAEPRSRAAGGEPANLSRRCP